MKVRVALVAFIGLSLGGCGAQPSPTPPGETSAVYVGGTWTAVEFGGLTPDALDRPRVQFTVCGQIHAVTDCRELDGPARIQGDRIAIGPLVIKDFGCEPADRQVDVAFGGALLAADRITGADGRLVLSGPRGDIVFVQPAPD